ncbi:IclR family transcriptional regulator [Bremerella sp. JC770]|uniref:IclR family transcriptional regulator n=1 Tax=Bremerella sp. JC770 TaxID=3232137 RepID=UPI00345B2248
MTKTKETKVPNLYRGISILEFLAQNQCSASIAELSERLGYPTASVFRITQELEQLGYLQRDPNNKRFSITNKFLLLGQPQGQRKSLVEGSIPALRALQKTTGETAQVCCLVEDKNVILEQVISSHPFKYSAELGARCPAYSCAPGKAIISLLPVEERKELINRLKLKRFTQNTITSRKAFMEEIIAANSLGYAVDNAEGLEGIHCIAAAIVDRNEYPIGALTIAGPAYRLPKSAFPEYGALLMEAAAQTSARLRH